MSSILPNTIEGLRRALRAGDVTLPEAIRAQQQRFQVLGASTRCVVTELTPHSLESSANAALSGVALAHKDIFDLSGWRPGLGRDRGALTPGLIQAAVLSRLDEAGAINLGTLAMAEDACSATGQTDHLPTPLNPLGHDLAVGGSSSGSAVAVASGMVYASLGTDTAGSVRIPAMTCGVMGLKTTHGLIDRQGMTLLSPSLDSIGLLARSVDDLSCVLGLLAPELAWHSAVSTGLPRMGYWLENTEVDSYVRNVIGPVMAHYSQRHIEIGTLERRASALQELMMAFEVGQTHRKRIANGLACRQVMGLGSFGLTVPQSWWVQALSQRVECLAAFVDAVFGEVDVLLAPLQTGVLPKTFEVYLGQPGFESAKLLGLHRYAGWVNYLGLPALCLPVGFGPDGLPVSIQLISKPFHEPHLLLAARQIQTDLHGEHGIMPTQGHRS